MEKHPTRHIKPEEEELDRKRIELSGLESDLADRELYLTTLRSELLTFERAYARIVGKRYAELDEIEAQIAELLANASPKDGRARNSATQARSKAKESREVVEKSLAAAHATRNSSYSETLRSVYREVAKRIHPDLATTAADRIRREQLMAQANKAYEEGDESRLRSILEEYEASPESVQGEGATAELVRVIRKIAQIRRRLAQIEDEAEILVKSELFALKGRADRATEAGRNLLSEMAKDLDSQLATSRERLHNLVGKKSDKWTTKIGKPK
jgi:DnaJ-domain-containing protein 1